MKSFCFPGLITWMANAFDNLITHSSCCSEELLPLWETQTGLYLWEEPWNGAGKQSEDYRADEMEGCELNIYPIPIPCAAQGGASRASTEAEPGKSKWEGAEEGDLVLSFLLTI